MSEKYVKTTVRLRASVGRRVVEARTGLGLSRPELSRKSGVRTTRIADIENGHALPSATTLYLLGQALGVPVDHLLWLDDEEGET